MKKGSESSSLRGPSNKRVGEIMIPRRRDFMGDLAEWMVESPENQKKLEKMLDEIFEDLAESRKARGEMPPPSKKSFTSTVKKPSKNKVGVKRKVKNPVPSDGIAPVDPVKAPAKAHRKKK